jgi:hypothetical protein
LEHPTETWAVQELRKANVLFAASQYVDAARSERYYDRGQAITKRAWETFLSFESRGFTRPLALILQQAYIDDFFSGNRPSQDSLPSRCSIGIEDCSFFKPQSAIVRKEINSPLLIMKMLSRAIRLDRRWSAIRRTWAVELVRRTTDKLH